jgi:hypothetical protein
VLKLILPSEISDCNQIINIKNVKSRKTIRTALALGQQHTFILLITGLFFYIRHDEIEKTGSEKKGMSFVISRSDTFSPFILLNTPIQPVNAAHIYFTL